MTTTAGKHLTTGWEPDLDLDDSLLRRALFCWAEVCELFSVNAGGQTARNAAFAISDYRRPSGLFNSAVLLQPPDLSTFHEVLAEIERFFAGGSGEALLWSAWPTPDLSRRGWHLYGHPPLMVRPPADLHRPPRAPSVPVVSVVDSAGLAAWERTAVEGYPLEELIPFVPGSFAHPSLLDDDRLKFTIGTDHDRPVSIGSLFVNPDIAFFLLAVTQPATRRRGHWQAHAVARLRAAPSVWAAGVFSDDSRGPARAIGFVPMLRLTLWCLPRSM